LVRRKYRLLFSSRPCPKKPGPKGPDEGVIRAIVELKSRNPRFGCPRIARIVSQPFGIDIDKNVVYRVSLRGVRVSCPQRGRGSWPWTFAGLKGVGRRDGWRASRRFALSSVEESVRPGCHEPAIT
jgi:hypothetical protein